MTEAGFIEAFEQRHDAEVLHILLMDHTTNHNIVWADDEYSALGPGFQAKDEITPQRVTGTFSGVIKPRVAKALEKQSLRTRSHAEVFTPSWLVNRMNNALDLEWFGHDLFNEESEDGRSWKTHARPVHFPKVKGKSWTAYVASPRLEITCGEAPFVCSRYDTVTGEGIPVFDRIGILDRKLRVVSERAASRKAWDKQALNAIKATYGYEYQGDNLLIARINVLETLCEHCANWWGDEPAPEYVLEAADIISWNLWQMDGLTDAVPSDLPVEEKNNGTNQAIQDALFSFDSDAAASTPGNEMTAPPCLIYDWTECKPVEFRDLKGKVA